MFDQENENRPWRGRPLDNRNATGADGLGGRPQNRMPTDPAIIHRPERWIIRLIGKIRSELIVKIELDSVWRQVFGKDLQIFVIESRAAVKEQQFDRTLPQPPGPHVVTAGNGHDARCVGHVHTPPDQMGMGAVPMP